MNISRRYLGAFVALIAVVLIIVILSWNSASSSSSAAYSSACDSPVRFIPIVGEIASEFDVSGSATSSQGLADSNTVIAELESANDDSNVKAIVLLIDSTGGSPQAAEEVVQVMQSIKKPEIALIRSEGDSAAYWIASAADQVISFRTSDIGSIGVTESFLDDAQALNDAGDQYVSITAGQFKDTGNPDKPITDAEKALLQRDVTNVYNIFVNQVAADRNLPVAKVQALADGSTMLGDMAVSDGLIDSDGGWTAVQTQLTKILGQPDPSMIECAVSQ